MIKIKVVKITEETNPNGVVLLRIKYLYNSVVYTSAARKSQYLDEKTRKRIHQLWIKKIKLTIKDKDENDINTKKGKTNARKLVELKTEEIEEDPYE